MASNFIARRTLKCSSKGLTGDCTYFEWLAGYYFSAVQVPGYQSCKRCETSQGVFRKGMSMLNDKAPKLGLSSSRAADSLN